MSRAAAIVLLLLGVVLGAPSAWADRAYGVEVLRTTPDRVSVDPGAVVTAAFRVTHAGPEARTFVESMELPPGWQPVTPPSRFRLEPGETRLRFVAVQAAADTPAGVHTLRYRVTDDADPAVHADEWLDVAVASVSKLSVVIDDRPSFVVAGEPVALSVRVINDGNAPLHAVLEATSAAGVRATVDRPAIDLAPRSTEQLVLTVVPSADTPRPTQHFVRVHARAGTLESSAVVGLSVVPRTDRVSLWRRFPLWIGTTATTDAAGRWGVQGELRGTGALDAKGKWTGDLLLRGPDAQDTGAFGLRDEYRATVQGPWLGVQLGDQNYALSWLTSPSRYGRGGGFTLSPGPLRVGAHVVAQRYAESPEIQLGGTVGTAFADQGRLAANVLHTFREEDDVTVASLSGLWTPSGDVRVEGEVAVDASDERTSWAGLLHAVGRLPGGFVFALREVVSAPAFSGYERDTHRTVASVSVPLAEKATLQAQFHRQERNLARDPAKGNAPVDWRGEIGVDGRPAKGWSLLGVLAGAVRQERLEGDAWHEGAARFHANYGSRLIAAGVQGAVGVRRDHDSGRFGVGEQVQGYLTYTPNSRLRLRAFAAWGSEDEHRSVLFSTDASVGLSTSWTPLDGLSFQLYGRHGLDPDRPRDEIDGTVRWTHRTGPTIAARWRTGWYAGEVEHAALLSVFVPVGLPIGRSGEMGAVEGRIFDADAAHLPGLAGVVVRAGSYVARTDEDGRFVFPRLPVGTYALTVDAATLGMERVGLENWPLRVEVTAGKTETVEVGTTTAAVLRGRVTKAGIADAGTRRGVVVGLGASTEDEPLPRTPVVVTDGTQRHVRLTDDAGEFELRGLRPGAWRVEVPVARVEGHADSAVRSILLAPGDRAVAEVVLEPEVRSIRRVSGDAPKVLSLKGDAPSRREVPRRTAPSAPSDAAPRRDTEPAEPAGPEAPAAGARRPGASPAPVAWEEASWSARATLSPAGDFLGGRVALALRDRSGREACTVEGGWFDDGGDLPVEPCVDCAWTVHTAVLDVRRRGPSCHDLGADALSFASGAWAWAPAWRAGERVLAGVLLRHDGRTWVPVATGVDGEEIEAGGSGELP